MLMKNRLLLLASAIALSGCGLGSATLRAGDGRLQRCPDLPHCVSSVAGELERRRIEPMRYQGNPEEARQALLRVLRAQARTEIVTEDSEYIHAEVTTLLSRYVDDVEFTFGPDAGVIQMRSSSRIGYYDFNANRDRLERIRSGLHLLIPPATP